MTTRPLLLAVVFVVALLALLLISRKAGPVHALEGTAETVDYAPLRDESLQVVSPSTLDKTRGEPKPRTPLGLAPPTEPSAPQSRGTLELSSLVTRYDEITERQLGPCPSASVTLSLIDHKTKRVLYTASTESGLNGRGTFVVPAAPTRAKLRLVLEASAPGLTCCKPWNHTFFGSDDFIESSSEWNFDHPAVILLEEGPLLHGLVLDSEGRVVPFADVHLEFLQEDSGKASIPIETSTHYPGSYQIVLGRIGVWRTSASRSGKGTTPTYDIEVTSLSDPSLRMDFRLNGVGVLSGFVKRADGLPVSGATVLAVERDALIASGVAPESAKPLNLRARFAKSDHGFRSASGETSPSGQFHLGGLLPGEYVVLACSAFTGHHTPPTTALTNGSPIGLEFEAVQLQVGFMARNRSATSRSDSLSVLLESSVFGVSLTSIGPGRSLPRMVTHEYWYGHRGEDLHFLVPPNTTAVLEATPFVFQLTDGPWLEPTQGLHTLSLSNGIIIEGNPPQVKMQIEIPPVRRPDSPDQPIKEYDLP